MCESIDYAERGRQNAETRLHEKGGTKKDSNPLEEEQLLLIELEEESSKGFHTNQEGADHSDEEHNDSKKHAPLDTLWEEVLG